MNKAKKSLSVILSFVMLICAFLPLSAYASTDAIKPLKKSVKLHCVAWGDPQVSHYLTEREPYLISSANDVKNNKKAPIDALILAGDITENCIQDEWDWVYDDIKDMGVKNYINATGNHDIRVHDYDDAIYKFTTFTNRLNRNAGSKLRIKKAYYSYKVNGYKFIVLGSEAATLEEAEISKKQLKWLDKELKSACKNNRPAFVIVHQPLKNTHGLPDTWGSSIDSAGTIGAQSDDVKNILNKYANAILITGHLHTGLGKYNYQRIGNIHSVNLPSVSIDNEDGKYNNNGIGYMLEVYNNQVLFRARNFDTGKYLPKYDININLYVRNVKLSKTKFKYDKKVKKPTVKAYNSKGRLIPKKYYTVKYGKGRKKPGKYKVTVTFKGKYKKAGKIVKYFKIK